MSYVRFFNGKRRMLFGLTCRFSMGVLLVILSMLAFPYVSSGQQKSEITLSLDRVSLSRIFEAIEAQTSYRVMSDESLISKGHLVSIHIAAAQVEEVLQVIFKGQPFTYLVEGNQILVIPKTSKVQGQKVSDPVVTYSGRVTAQGVPLVGASVQFEGKSTGVLSDQHGGFTIKSGSEVNGYFVVSYVGFYPQRIKLPPGGSQKLQVELQARQTTLEGVEIVSTGYQLLPKERVTGSFVQVGNELYNRSTGANVLDRLTGVVSGLRFSTNDLSGSLNKVNPLDRSLGLFIRGQSTLSGSVGTDPLIVVNSFPYDGDLRSINPNDVETVTVLKDAAAASIWGARSANGVIVITTKKGKLNARPKVELNMNATTMGMPDLFYDRNFLSSGEYIDAEKYLFEQGYFDSDLADPTGNLPQTPVVGILAGMRSGSIPVARGQALIGQMKNNDVRREYQKMYQKARSAQYSIGIRGGSDQLSYSFSMGYDKGMESLKRNGSGRLTLNALNSYTPTKNLELTVGINYSSSKQMLPNQVGYGAISVGGYKYGMLYPYALFTDLQGNPAATTKDYTDTYLERAEKDGFMDWRYRPLDELRLADHYNQIGSLLLRLGAKYKITRYLNLEVQYQNERQDINVWNHQNAQSYYARNLINRFAVRNSDGVFSYRIPVGGILDIERYHWNTHNARIQLSYDKRLGQGHQLTAIAGAEARENKSEGFKRRSYGYDDLFGTSTGDLNFTDYLPVQPAGVARIPVPDGNIIGILNRYVSYFANAAYGYKGRYTFSISGRRDGANIFGVRTNDKITPLWSAGLGWTMNEEKFFRVSWLDRLHLRVSYGYNGNVYNGSGYVTGTYAQSSLNGVPVIQDINPANPSLSWEKVRNVNLGVDFSAFGGRINGSAEWFEKKGQGLIETRLLAPSSGFNSINVNAASTLTRGVDLTFNSVNLQGALKWNSILLVSSLHDKLTSYSLKPDANNLAQVNGVVGIVGYPLYGLFSYKWGGLDGVNGDPVGYLNGKLSRDYTGILNGFHPDSLVYSGSSRPTLFGSLRNDFSYKGFTLSINISFESGFNFRRPSTSLNYTDLLLGYGNVDYGQRWKTNGDENHTSVPSVVYPANADRNTFYKLSSALITKGDNIRLNDIRLSYDLCPQVLSSKPISTLQVYVYAKNLGLLYRANSYGIDPQVYSSSVYTHTLPNPFSVAFGMKAVF